MQHRHFKELDNVKQYIMQLLQDEVLPIEFFLLGKRRFGGEIKKTDYDGLTKDFLANYSGYSVDYISQLNMRFTVGRGNSVILHLQKTVRTP